MTQTLGRRERKKQETRRALVAAALELFAAKGFDAVTVSEIAEAADVDPSTFFRHFPAKEAVLLFADVNVLPEQFEAALLARPADEPLLSAATQALQAVFDQLQASPEQERVREQLMATTPSVRAWMADVLTRTSEALSSAIAKRMDVDVLDDPRPRLLAALVVQAGDWVRYTRLAKGKTLDDHAFAVDIPKALDGIRPILERKV